MYKFINSLAFVAADKKEQISVVSFWLVCTKQSIARLVGSAQECICSECAGVHLNLIDTTVDNIHSVVWVHC